MGVETSLEDYISEVNEPKIKVAVSFFNQMTLSTAAFSAAAGKGGPG